MKTLLATALVAVTLSVSATVAYAHGAVIPPSQQNDAGQAEAADAVVPGAGREVIPPAQQNFKGKAEGSKAVVPGAGREVIPPADQRG
jgi:predicted carbohydrate-binding protein with CBM5 and CBM33 domain